MCYFNVFLLLLLLLFFTDNLAYKYIYVCLLYIIIYFFVYYSYRQWVFVKTFFSSFIYKKQNKRYKEWNLNYYLVIDWIQWYLFKNYHFLIINICIVFFSFLLLFFQWIESSKQWGVIVSSLIQSVWYHYRQCSIFCSLSLSFFSPIQFQWDYLLWERESLYIHSLYTYNEHRHVYCHQW